MKIWTVLLMGFFGFVHSLYGQTNSNMSSGEIILLPYLSVDPVLDTWQGGERTQISRWDQLVTVSNIAKPTLLAYLPETSKATGTAIIIAPGGGFHLLSIENEGIHMAKWCVENGIAAFVLKYRLVPTGENPDKEFSDKLSQSQEKMDRDMAPYIKMAKADALEAITYIRANAGKFNVASDKIGIIGFSAGGTLAAMAGLEYTSHANRPDFIAPIYGALHVLDLTKVPAKPMPLFLSVAGDDGFGFQNQTIALYKTWNAAKVPAEMHIYEKGGHGFGMRKQSLPSDQWIVAFDSWMKNNGF